MASFPLLFLPPPVVGHESGLFNPRVVVGGEALSTAAAAYTTTSNDCRVRVSVRLELPPAESYLHMQTDDTLLKDPLVLAACGDLLLVHMVVHDAADDLSCKQNLFVYKAHPTRPSLSRLPNPDTFTGWAQSCGIVPCDDGGFVVASFRTIKTDLDLQTGLAMERVEFLHYSPATGHWDLKSPTMPYDGEALKPCLWETDQVFSYPDGTIYWVDYHRGLLSCNVLSAGENLELRFIQLPGIEIWTELDDLSYGRVYPEAYRTVGVCKGIVNFVDIDNGFFGSMKKSGFTVTVWTLKMPELEWHQTSMFQVDDLWALANFRESSLPRWVPQFPIVNTHDNHGLYFILQECDSFGEDWIITVDMHNKVLQSYERRIYSILE
ncbi:unnamed protein product [Triticum turgidum subsp. durum]|uniref:DUF1618 domain-containing protein n=1 Tax=Triticum turgidum subsp. durum TaxID=4567 RepID=A0A9R1S3T6_TRITD|nr:unnamed protein product [Triticum turgidum subsp. durum]